MFERRPLDPELMDLPAFDRQQVLDTFRFIRPVNRWLGGQSAMVAFLQRESESWADGSTIHVLDAGCGAGDLTLALARWARRTGHRLRIHAVDNHRDTLQLARQQVQGFPEISFACRDVFDLPAGRYHYVVSSMFLHHFADDDVPAVLWKLLSLARRKVCINDLIRSPIAYAGTWLFTLFTSAVFRHDARLSVRKGFRPTELAALLKQNGLSDFRLQSRFFYRVLLTIDKPSPRGGGEVLH